MGLGRGRGVEMILLGVMGRWEFVFIVRVFCFSVFDFGYIIFI